MKSILTIFLSCVLSLGDCKAGLTSEEIFKVPMQRDDDPLERSAAQIIQDAGTQQSSQDNLIKMEDMRIDPLQFAFMIGNLSSFAGSFDATERARWPKNIIPYEITDIFDDKEKQVIYGAMREWQERTCIRFEPLGKEIEDKVGHRNGISITDTKDNKGCSSSVGFQKYVAELFLSKQGCVYHRTVVHELGHAIGLYHEQNRRDRDQYIGILYDNLPFGARRQFWVAGSEPPKDVPYDYCSIMQYHNKAFSVNSGLTMVTKDFDYTYSLGQTKEIRFSDAKTVNTMYKCNSHCSETPTCQSPCYLNHKCECECETKDCPKSPCESHLDKEMCDRYRQLVGVEIPTTPPPPKCVDSWSSCRQIAEQGRCLDPRVLLPCPQACGICDLPCEDQDLNCVYLSKRGDCNLNPSFMYYKCTKTCGMC